MKQEYFVSLIMPVRNDASFLSDFVNKANEMLKKNYEMYEILVIDDGSRDETPKTIETILHAIPCVRYVQLAKHYGKEMAISAGLDYAIGDFVVVMNLHRDPLALMPEMIARAIAGNSVVYGVDANGKNEAIFSRIASFLFHWYCNRFLNIHIPRYATDFIVLSRKSVNAMSKIKHLNNYIKLFSHYTGFKNQNFLYRPLNKKSDGIFQKVKIGVDIIISNSSHPLRFITFLGFFASVINIGYIGYVITVYFLKKKVIEGWTTTSLQTSVMFFFLFLILAMFSEYLGRLLNEQRGKEPYIIADEKSSSVLISKHTAQKRNIVKHST